LEGLQKSKRQLGASQQRGDRSYFQVVRSAIGNKIRRDSDGERQFFNAYAIALEAELQSPGRRGAALTNTELQVLAVNVFKTQIPEGLTGNFFTGLPLFPTFHDQFHEATLDEPGSVQRIFEADRFIAPSLAGPGLFVPQANSEEGQEDIRLFRQIAPNLSAEAAGYNEHQMIQLWENWNLDGRPKIEWNGLEMGR
jgi:hypothetical protein